MTSHVRRQALSGAIMLLSLAGPSAAQEIPEFHKLRTPTSPGFVILGIAPAQVERPTAPAAFTASLLENAKEALNGLPNSYAVEFGWAAGSAQRSSRDRLRPGRTPACAA